LRISGYMALHYGADYANWAVRSVIDAVDEFHVVYAPRPSHGTMTHLSPPDSKNSLLAAVMVSPKIRWHEVNFRQEGRHRDHALSLCRGDLALVVDYDEVWDSNTLDAVLRFAADNPQRDTLVGCRTLWRSHGWLCEDPMQPVRVIKRSGQGVAAYPLDAGRFWHFGYAVRDQVVRYKMAVHGHIGEWRHRWYEDKWSPWPPVKDVHPTCRNTWDPEPFDRRLLPEIIRDHPWHEEEPIV